MKMKDSPDYLTARAANPRTGMISPSLAPSSPISLRTPETPGEALRVAALRVTIPDNSDDQFVVRMPSAREPQPYAYPGFDAEEIRTFEERRSRSISGSSSQNRHTCIERQHGLKPGGTLKTSSTTQSIIARRPVPTLTLAQPHLSQTTEPNLHTNPFRLSQLPSFFIAAITSLCSAITILCAENSPPQQKLTALTTALFETGKIAVSLLIAWYVGSIVVFTLEKLLWPLLVVLGVFRLSR